MTSALDLALDLMSAKHPDNPNAPASMIQAGCATPLAKALWDLGWRRQTTTSAPGVAAPAESTPAPSTSGASARTSAEVVHLPECAGMGCGPTSACSPECEQDMCAHQWLDRPESDSRQCLICGVEG